MQRRALHVAIADGVLLRPPTRPARIGIVLGHAAVVVQPDHRSCVVIGSLRAPLIAAIAERDVEQPVAIEYQARAEVLPGTALGQLAKDHLDVFELAARETAAG